ncbi:alpha,alpha-trehalase TreF [Ferruginibacter sp. SUN106]|uniref:alpha,alpha-trehalase TreF n=1 Tax=Ferruginibacter sp. SUN106 TaxID=2978348 RepID=UPI003D36D53A
MKQLLILPLLFLLIKNSAAQQPAAPDKIYGQLFVDVQLAKIFPDGKTFVDCTPKRKVRDIMYDYGLIKGPNLNLKKFVDDNFNTPPPPPAFNYIIKEPVAANHIKNLWSNLQRDADKAVEGSSLLPLPKPYIVPGGRFREVYYWDSYFTMLGLKESGQTAMIENMVDNFAFLIDTYGHIPNGNRTYYLSRSQPPYFSLMVELLAEIEGDKVYKTYLPQLEKEYNYWMEGADKIKNGDAFKRVVKLDNGVVLNRYWDDYNAPRQESYKEDFELAENVSQELAMRIRMSSPEALKKILDESKAAVYRNLRAGASSGWDFSSRWFADEKNISSIQTVNIIPVDLNCLLYKLELTLEKACKISKQEKKRKRFNTLAFNREKSFRSVFYSKTLSFFSDYNFVTKKTTDIACASSVMILSYLREPNPEGIGSWGNSGANFIKKYLLRDGGIVTTTNNTGQQWDAPNGWAPLQWIAVTSLNRCFQKQLAKDIATRWLTLNDKVYAATGKMMEKYNVEDLAKEAGGGEYPSQDGFGWTNGVYLALKAFVTKK